ncbi:MAG TPA: NAD(P)/FAD-dependent oxidoreductase [Saprospiraceae bacterium]|nr:NAD(P)/FAD-dependent oxidoreductase [Saprospiraceae bacterium]
MIDQNRTIQIAGSGLVGSLLALRLLQRGFNVKVYESRPDMRKSSISAGRSINLALSHRGIQALKSAGLEKEILENAIKMEGRLIHDLEGNLTFQAYSSRPGEFINSISRRTLNVILMDAIEKIKPKAIQFNTQLKKINSQSGIAVLENELKQSEEFTFDLLIGTDGAASACRQYFMEQSARLHFNYSQVFQNYGYKELTIPPGPNNKFLLEKNALHIWPRGHFMMIALPNPDATFTATLFLPYHGSESFEVLKNEDQLVTFFNTHFKDAISLIPHLTQEFFQNPTGHLYTVKCSPWHDADKVLLMGDAAHAIIPFYGQGMNCGFEDVFIFDQLLDQNTDWNSICKSFSEIRKPNSDAIADLAEDNFIEMRDKVADPVFQRKRKLEMQLEKQFPEYYSKYAMVTFRPDISYHDAMIKGRNQDELLMNICASEKSEWTESELKEIYNKLVNLSL